MQYKNARWTRHGGIDCDIEHPVYGWIPFTAKKDDVESFGVALFAELEASGNVAPFNPDEYPLPPEGVLFLPTGIQHSAEDMAKTPDQDPQSL